MTSRAPKRSLNVLTVESPCEQPWDEMEARGDARRFCGMCMQDVYDLSKLTTAEAEELVFRKDPACVRFFRRLDGTVVTSDCTPVRMRAFTRVAGGVVRTGPKVLGLLLACVAALGMAQAAKIDVLGWLAKTPVGKVLLPGFVEPPLAGAPMMVEMPEDAPVPPHGHTNHGHGSLPEDTTPGHIAPEHSGEATP